MSTATRRFALPILVAVAALASAPAAFADTIFSNLGSGASYAPDQSWAVWGSSISTPTGSAMQFTVGATSYDLSEVEIALVNLGGTSGATVELFNSAGSTPGATVLGSWALTGLPASGESSIQPAQTITGITGIELAADTTYWLAAFPANSTTFDGWAVNNTGDTASFVQSNTGGSTWNSPTSQSDGAFALFGTKAATTPEPGGLPLLTLGLVALSLFYRRILRA